MGKVPETPKKQNAFLSKGISIGCLLGLSLIVISIGLVVEYITLPAIHMKSFCEQAYTKLASPNLTMQEASSILNDFRCKDYRVENENCIDEIAFYRNVNGDQCILAAKTGHIVMFYVRSYMTSTIRLNQKAVKVKRSAIRGDYSQEQRSRLRGLFASEYPCILDSYMFCAQYLRDIHGPEGRLFESMIGDIQQQEM